MTPQHRSTLATTLSSRRPEDADLFLRRYGDVIDDHLAEIVDEVVAAQIDRHRPRLRLPLIVVVLAATGVSLFLRSSPATVAVIWASAAVICGCLAALARPRGELR